MHASSLENMRLCYRRFIQGEPLESAGKAAVLDFGGANANGTYRAIFPEPQFGFIGTGIAPGNGISVVLDDPYTLPFADASIDIVVSGQSFAHCEFFWLAFAEMARVLKPEGYIFLIAPSAGPVHRYPVDCYRFYPDAYDALAKYAKCQLIDVWRDERGPWHDLVGVFRRHDAPLAPPSNNRPQAQVTNARPVFRGAPEEEITKGNRAYRDILGDIHRELAPSLYLEIGVRRGYSLALARCPAVGVDPFPDIAAGLPATADVIALTSDDFFAGPHKEWLTLPLGLAFIDGMHLFEFALRDFMHIERAVSPGTLVVVDDIFPNHPAQAARQRRTVAWTGDVWKLHHCLRKYRPDLFLLPVDASPAGLLIVCGLDQNNRVLWENYNPIVSIYASAAADPPPEVLSRAGAHCGASETLARICEILRGARSSSQPGASIVERLQAIPLHAGEVSQTCHHGVLSS
ncbi:MAG: methyltransferase domain-containing protein [Beijerinckiaceae bacterium]|nr:methyltransferase domain-containing protein [Beijerinckiaceae bacterium]